MLHAGKKLNFERKNAIFHQTRFICFDNSPKVFHQWSISLNKNFIENNILLDVHSYSNFIFARQNLYTCYHFLNHSHISQHAFIFSCRRKSLINHNSINDCGIPWEIVGSYSDSLDRRVYICHFQMQQNTMENCWLVYRFPGPQSIHLTLTLIQ